MKIMHQFTLVNRPSWLLVGSKSAQPRLVPHIGSEAIFSFLMVQSIPCKNIVGTHFYNGGSDLIDLYVSQDVGKHICRCEKLRDRENAGCYLLNDLT